LIEPFKYILQIVALERDDETGKIVREVPSEPFVAYAPEQIINAVLKFEDQIVQQREGVSTE
jgi:hypothetical protein